MNIFYFLFSFLLPFLKKKDDVLICPTPKSERDIKEEEEDSDDDRNYLDPKIHYTPERDYFQKALTYMNRMHTFITAKDLYKN